MAGASSSTPPGEGVLTPLTDLQAVNHWKAAGVDRG